MLREERSSSQILFNLLPEQTADMGGRIWKVSGWRDPLRLAVDDGAVRRRLLSALAPWSVAQPRRDNFAADQILGRHSLEVVELNKDRGVAVDPWPQVWVCQACRRIDQDSSRTCVCGQRRWSQLHFVGFHECGYVTEPWIPRCPEHNQIRINAPRTAQAKDLRFSCPICNRETLRGLGAGRPCRGCNRPGMSYTVHRAASVYTSHSFTMVNPARPDQLRELQALGGSARCLDWLLDGMSGDRPDAAPQSFETLVETLILQGLPRIAAEAAARAASSAGHEFSDSSGAVELPGQILDEAREEALDLTIGVYNGRRSASLLHNQVAGDELRQRYETRYPTALAAAGLQELDLVDRFPVLRGVFGYSRDASSPDSRLNMFRGRNGAFRVYADSNETEAFLLRLNPVRVAKWLETRGLIVGASENERTARLQILQQTRFPGRGDDVPTETAGSAVLTLLHSYVHRLIRTTAVYAGIDRDSLSEYLVPGHLAAFVYAGSRGDFVLGGLQAVFEGDLDDLLNHHVSSDSRCPLDPGCSRSVGACPACLHLGEPSCSYYNRFLDRRTLFGPSGFLHMEGVQ